MAKETKFRIEEAIARAKANGKKVFKKELGAKLFPDVSETVVRINMTNLCSGKTKRIKPEWVGIICEECECTPNYLFGYENI